MKNGLGIVVGGFAVLIFALIAIVGISLIYGSVGQTVLPVTSTTVFAYLLEGDAVVIPFNANATVIAQATQLKATWGAYIQIADGVNDDVDTAAAFAVANHVIVAQGTLSFGAAVTIPANGIIEGQGVNATVINRDAINPVLDLGGYGIIVKNLSMDAGGISTGAEVGWIKENITIGGVYTSFAVANPIHIYEYATNNSADSSLAILRNWNNASGTGSGHGFADSSDLNRGGTTAYASFDARSNFSSSGYSYDHYIGFQTLTTYNNPATITNFIGNNFNPVINKGIVSNLYANQVLDVQGAGTINHFYGYYADNLTRGAPNNFAFYASGSTPNFFGGHTGIGDLPLTDYTLNVNETIAAPSASKVGTFSSLSHTGNTGNFNLYGGNFISIFGGNSSSSGAHYGILAQAKTTGATNSLTAAIGTFGLAGLAVNAFHNSGGNTITALAGVAVLTWGVSVAGGTATNAIGMYVASPAVTGTVNNAFGLYMENMTGAGTSNFAIYSKGGSSYHEGNLGIGTTTAGHVTASGTHLISFQDATAPSGTGPASLFATGGKLYAIDSTGAITKLTP